MSEATAELAEATGGGPGTLYRLLYASTPSSTAAAEAAPSSQLCSELIRLAAASRALCVVSDCEGR